LDWQPEEHVTMADPPLAPALVSPLVGRDRERATVRDHLAAALAGHGSLVLIGGEAGIGKTALAEALLAEAADQGALVLVGRCYDLSETPPYGPWAAALALAPRGDDQPTPPDLSGHGVASQGALFAAVRDHLAARALRQPVVLLLDDLHWADPASLDLIRVLARDLADRPLLLLATYRADEIARHPLYALLPLLVREARAARLDLRPLGDGDVRALVRARYALPAADEERLVVYLRGRAEGNPLYLGELLRALEEAATLRADGSVWTLGDLTAARVPPLLQQVIAGRVARLGPEAEGLLDRAATLGQTFPLTLWAAVAGVDEEALLPTLERAVAARVLDATPDGAGARFAHALIREALYERTLAPRRRRWHRRAAEVLAALPGSGPDLVAGHFQQADDERALPWLLAAGARAEDAYAIPAACARYGAAVRLLERRPGSARARAWLLYHMGRLQGATDPAAARAALDEATPLAEEAGDRRLAAALLVLRGVNACTHGDLRAGLAAMRAGLAAPADGPAPGGDLVSLLGPALGRIGEPRPDPGLLATWLASAGEYAAVERLGSGTGQAAPDLPHVALGLARSRAARGLPDAARRDFARARAGYAAAHNPLQIAAALLDEMRFVALPYRADRPGEREALLAAGRRLVGTLLPLFDRAGRVPDLGGMLEAPALHLAGRWAEARAHAERWLAGIRAAGVVNAFTSQATAVLALIAAGRGDGATLGMLVAEVLPQGPATEPGDCFFRTAVVLQRAAADRARDAEDLPAARAWLMAHDRWLAWSTGVLGRAEGALGWAAYHRATGDAALARQHAEAALAHASDPRQPLALLAAHRLLGELATAAGRYAAARAHLDDALALAAACAAPYERALTLLALADLRAAIGDRDGAATALADARAILEPLEARPALARADTLAARLVAAPPLATAPPVDPAGLTAREVEVLRLVARGLTNRAVAARLAVSPRTVGAHLAAVYGKLGVATRTAAAHEGRRRGLA
jgi:DNA-binding CsgD family transcriptional regulator